MKYKGDLAKPRKYRPPPGPSEKERFDWRRAESHERSAVIGALCEWHKVPRGAAHVEPADVKRLKALTSENAKLKKLLAERDLEIEVMKEINRKNVWSASRLQGR